MFHIFASLVVGLVMHDSQHMASAFVLHPPPLPSSSASASVSSSMQHRQEHFRHGEAQSQRCDSMTLNMVEAADVATFYSSCLDNYYVPTQMAIGATFSTLGDILAQSRKIYLSSNDDAEGDSGASDGDFGNLWWSQYDPGRTMNYFLKGMGGGVMWACWYQFVDVWSLDVTNELFSTMPSMNSELAQSSMAPTLADAAFANDRALMESTGMAGVAGSSASSKFFQPTRTAVSILLEQFIACPIVYTFWDIPVPALLSGSPPRQIPVQVQQKLGPLLIANAKVWTLVNTVTYNLPLQYRVLFASFADIIWQCINASITSQSVVVADRGVATSPTSATALASASASRTATRLPNAAAIAAPGMASMLSSTVPATKANGRGLAKK